MMSHLGLLSICLVSLARADPPEVFDCWSTYDNWKTGWTPGWKAWCCLNHQRGCEETHTSTTTSGTTTSSTVTSSTSTRTSSTSTVTTSTRTSTSTQTQTSSTSTDTSTTQTRTSTTWTSTTTVSPEAICARNCSQGGLVATCSSRIMWASQHVTMDDQNVCEAAAVVVTSDCPIVCGGCTAAASGCSEDPIFIRKYQKTMRAGIPVDHRHWSAVAGLVALGGVVAFVTRRTSRARRALYDDVLLLEEQA